MAGSTLFTRHRLGVATLVLGVGALIVGVVAVVATDDAAAECEVPANTTAVVFVEPTEPPVTTESATTAAPAATDLTAGPNTVAPASEPDTVEGDAETAPPPEAAAEPEVSTASLHPDHEGATNPGFQAEDDDRCPTGQWGWHFVMPTSGTDFLSLTATFVNDGAVSASAFYSAGGQVKHAYVFTSGPDTLVTATAQVEGPGTRFNLSHVCEGGAATTTTLATTSTLATTTTALTTTTTTSSTTTTSIVTPSLTSTTVSPTTETTAVTTPTDSSVAPTTAAAAQVDTLPKSCPVVVPTSSAADDDGVLARTGADSGWLLVVGALLVAGGAALLWVNHRREA